MTVYADLVMILNFLVDYLLLMGTNRLCGYSGGRGRTALAATIGAVYSGICLLPGMVFLGNPFWRIISLVLICAVSFGLCRSALRRAAVFILLSMSLGGVALKLGRNSVWSLVAGGVVICFLCAVGFRDKIGSASYVPVELNYGGKRIRLTALRDTGNTLQDPITGRSVLVVDADVALQLTGLTQQQLCRPVEALSNKILPGLRLVPYRGIGQNAGFLLAVHMQDVRIGQWRGSSLVAFAPNDLSREGAYQALTGGVA